jgi:hypothetical protein
MVSHGDDPAWQSPSDHMLTPETLGDPVKGALLDREGHLLEATLSLIVYIDLALWQTDQLRGDLKPAGQTHLRMLASITYSAKYRQVTRRDTVFTRRRNKGELTPVEIIQRQAGDSLEGSKGTSRTSSMQSNPVDSVSPQSPQSSLSSPFSLHNLYSVLRTIPRQKTLWVKRPSHTNDSNSLQGTAFSSEHASQLNKTRKKRDETHTVARSHIPTLSHHQSYAIHGSPAFDPTLISVLAHENWRNGQDRLNSRCRSPHSIHMPSDLIQNGCGCAIPS